VEGSVDGETWRMLDDRSTADQVVPHERHAQSALFGLGSSPPAAGPSQALPPPIVRILSSREQMEVWTSARARRPAEFVAAHQLICISPELMGKSRLDGRVAALETKLLSCPLTESFTSVAAQLVARAFGVAVSKAARFHGSVPGLADGCFYAGAMRVHDSLEEWQARLLHGAMREMVASEATELQIVCALLLRASNECQARKHHVFLLVIERMSADGAADQQGELAEGDKVQQSRRALLEAAQDVVDELKDKAFASVFTEPTKMYYRAVGDATMEGDVDVHGANTYLALLLASLGVRLARAPCSTTRPRALLHTSTRPCPTSRLSGAAAPSASRGKRSCDGDPTPGASHGMASSFGARRPGHSRTTVSRALPRHAAALHPT